MPDRCCCGRLIGGVFRDRYVPCSLRLSQPDKHYGLYVYELRRERRWAKRDGFDRVPFRMIRRWHYYGKNAGLSFHDIRRAMIESANA